MELTDKTNKELINTVSLLAEKMSIIEEFITKQSQEKEKEKGLGTESSNNDSKTKLTSIKIEKLFLVFKFY